MPAIAARLSFIVTQTEIKLIAHKYIKTEIMYLLIFFSDKGDFLKKITALIIVIIMIFCSCAPAPEETETAEPQNEIRGVWIFYRELSMENESGGDEESFENKIAAIYDNCIKAGINTVFVHVRAFADSFYPSRIFPWSKYLTGEQGKSVDYDPLKIMIEQAHKRGLSFHAWLNPFRIQLDSEDENKLCDSNPVKKLLNEKSRAVCKTAGGIYFNPADLSAQKLILDGIREIVLGYDVDGIHIDDYFYPSTDENIDKKEYESYQKSGGRLTLAQWRKECVSSFVSGMYSAVKSIKSNVIVSISPAGNIDNNLNSLFADVKEWCSKPGFCDWIIPQIYFGFENKTLPLKEAADEWSKTADTSKVTLLAGLAVYKAAAGEGEWSDADIISRQTQYLKSCGNYSGFCCFSYSSIVSDNFNENLNALTVITQTPTDSAGDK